MFRLSIIFKKSSKNTFFLWTIKILGYQALDITFERNRMECQANVSQAVVSRLKERHSNNDMSDALGRVKFWNAYFYEELSAESPVFHFV